jgi:hypothetical protein
MLVTSRNDAVECHFLGHFIVVPFLSDVAQA